MRLPTLVVAVCVVMLATPGPLAASFPAGTEVGQRPNIVVVYMDDVSPHDGRLWSDPLLTPTLHDRFVAHGVEFTNAIGETPFCCPGRAGLLTGLHTHNTGVITNDGRLFRPQMHIGRALQDAGYTTMYVGKYLNMNNLLTPAQWTQHGAGWNYLDAVYGANGAYMNYRLHTKTGFVPYAGVHSTRMVAERTVEHLRQTPADSPVFAVMSIYNLHGPNTPMPEFKTDTRCNTTAPWKPANYNEADVSDKPPFIRSQPLLPNAGGWPMTGYCREMLGVDWAVKTVVDELAAQGRLDNTVLVMTADNGMTWGAHRLGQKKVVPYATPVPLYMSWPAGWGTTPRKVDETVVNIDLAPTFCALAGSACVLGPYPGGQQHPDGVSILPLLGDPPAPSLGRDAVLESAWVDRKTASQMGGPLPSWHALRTTASNPLGLWHYVEYDDGFRELYDLSLDPHEMTNVANRPDLANLRAELAIRLDELFREGRASVSALERPDGMIALRPSSSYKGQNVYATVPKDNQTAIVTTAMPMGTYEFMVKIANRNRIAPAAYSIRGKAPGSSLISVSYLVGVVDVTRQIQAGTYIVEDVPPGGVTTLLIRMKVGSAPPLAQRASVLTIRNVTEANAIDVVRGIVVLAPPPPTPSPSPTPTPTATPSTSVSPTAPPTPTPTPSAPPSTPPAITAPPNPTPAP